jgi:hypothetical protein
MRGLPAAVGYSRPAAALCCSQKVHFSAAEWAAFVPLPPRLLVNYCSEPPQIGCATVAMIHCQKCVKTYHISI